MTVGPRRAVPVLVAVATTLAACSAGPSPAADPSAGDAAPGSGTLTVFAAASLRTTFTRLGKEFETAHPGVRVALTFGGSSDLVAQLDQGAPGDVLASADERTMTRAVDGGLVTGTPTPFARNRLTIVTAPGNPTKITDLATLAAQSAAGTKVVVCAPPVPCGTATGTIEKASGVDIAPVSEEQSVTDVLGKVISGQADAGIVYRTDAGSAGDKVAVVDFPESHKAVNVYPIAALKSAGDPTTAGAFVDFVAGPRGRGVLSDAGFGTP